MKRSEHKPNDEWRTSRSGAWATRGFHFQHLFTSLILARQWAGLAPTGLVVPEGLEDCVLELPSHSVWFQIKSRKEGTFSKAEIDSIQTAIAVKAARIASSGPVRTIVALEQPANGIDHTDTQSALEATSGDQVAVCRDPAKELLSLIAERFEIPELIAEGIASDIYFLVASTASENASVDYNARRRISTTEIEKRVLERLESEQLSALEPALRSRAIEPIDFQTAVDEPGFYQGVKVNVGHVAANLVLARAADTRHISSELKKRRCVLISGPSGAGKSALLWLTAKELSGKMRWFQVGQQAAVSSADDIVRFVRARRPSISAPIALAFDEVNSSNNDVWNTLTREFRSFPDVYLIGSIRNEDVNLLSNLPDTAVVSFGLDDETAKGIWQQLQERHQTNWSHWREPFEISEGLMLEYTHILTAGARLEDTIQDQINIREKENRTHELSIIRATAEICARGGEIDVKRLIGILKIPDNEASLALKRLVNEHLVRETRPGVLGGLHALRSNALVAASHDELINYRSISVTKGLHALTVETMPRVIQALVYEANEADRGELLSSLAELLSRNNTVEMWVAVISGIGLANLEICADTYAEILKMHGIMQAHWFLASIWADADIKPPSFEGHDNFNKLHDACVEFREIEQLDLRKQFMELLPEALSWPSCKNLEEAEEMLSSFAPILGGHRFEIHLTPSLDADALPDIEKISTLLQAAAHISKDIAIKSVENLGGEEKLFDWFFQSTPWVSRPVIVHDEERGRTVRCEWGLVGDQYQGDPVTVIPELCTLLMGLSPQSDAVNIQVVQGNGDPISVYTVDIWSKYIAGENLPKKPQVTWNKAFRDILLSRASQNSLTAYADEFGEILREVEKLFRTVSEYWITSKKIPNIDSFVSRVESALDKADRLAYADTAAATAQQPEKKRDRGTGNDLGALVTSVIGNFINRLPNVPGDENSKAMATFCGDLADKAKTAAGFDVWRMSMQPPCAELLELSDRLRYTSYILHEISFDSSAPVLRRLAQSARKSRRGGAIRLLGQACHRASERRLENELKTLHLRLKSDGHDIEFVTRPLPEPDCVYWPPVEVAAIFEITDLETELESKLPLYELLRDALTDRWPLRIVPRSKGKIFITAAVTPSNLGNRPDVEFAKNWSEALDLHASELEIAPLFELAGSACVDMSTIINWCYKRSAHPIEEDALDQALDTFQTNRDALAQKAAELSDEIFSYCVDRLDDFHNRVAEEWREIEAGRTVESPICTEVMESLSPSPPKDGFASEIAAGSMLLREAEIRMNS